MIVTQTNSAGVKFTGSFTPGEMDVKSLVPVDRSHPEVGTGALMKEVFDQMTKPVKPLGGFTLPVRKYPVKAATKK